MLGEDFAVESVGAVFEEGFGLEGVGTLDGNVREVGIV